MALKSMLSHAVGVWDQVDTQGLCKKGDLLSNASGSEEMDDANQGLETCTESLYD